MTHHTGCHPHIEAPPLIPEIIADPEHTSSKPSPNSSRTTVKHQDKKHKRVTIDDPQLDYYSSDDNSSDSEDDLN